MRKKNFKDGRVLKAKSCKCVEMLKLYDKLQIEYVKLLEADENVEEFYCNVSISHEYNTDFIGVYKNGDKFVRECVFRNQISLPRMCKLLDESRNYWLKQGIIDWGIVTEKEEENEDN